MAIFQSMFSFFLPSRRRPIPTPPYAPQAAPVVEAFNTAFAAVDALDVPIEVKANFEKDLKAAFKVEAEKRPGYEPGRVAPVEVNLLNLFSNPAKTAWETLDRSFEMGLPALSVAWQKPEEEVWKGQFKGYWQKVPYSTKQAILRWTENAGMKATREAAEKFGIRSNPGLVFMMASNIQRVNPNFQVGGVPIDAIRRTAVFYEQDITSALAREDWAGADAIQKKWVGTSKKYREGVIRQFDVLSRTNPNFATTLEAQLWNYWKYRNLHYRALNLLKTYQKDGLSGVARTYLWNEFRKRVFKEGTPLYYIYLPNAVSALRKATIDRFLKPVLNQITSLRAWASKLWKQTAGKAVTKILVWLGEKLGLKALGAAIGSAFPGAGTAVGAIIGAVVQFVGEMLFKKVMVPVGKIVAYALVGAVGFFVLFAIAVVTLISIILSNKPYPWEAVATELDCDTSATATASCFPKSLVQQIADSWGVGPGNQVEACYSDVVAKSNEAGVDPGIALATWLHESNASNYELYARLGEPPQDFGIPSLAGQGFTAQIASFFNLYNSFYPSEFASCYTGHSEMEGFFRAFSTAGREEFGVGQCPNLTPDGESLVQEYIKTYNDISVCN